MTLKEFLNRYNHSPVDLETIAYRATKIEDNKPLQRAASEYLVAQDKLQGLLDDAGFEFG